MKNRFFSLFFTTVLVLVLLPVTASASTHTHTLCGGSSCTCTSYSHSSQTWTAWDGTTTLYNGYYYLSEDIELTQTMILNYSYTTYLCLNGHSITYNGRVFDIYSYRNLHITDCVGTGKVEGTGSDCTIGNNKLLSIWGGNILNSGGRAAIDAYASTSTYIRGGRVESNYDTIYAYPGSKIQIEGGTVHTSQYSCYAVGGHGDTSGTLGSLTITGGTVTATKGNSSFAPIVLNLQNGSFTMSGGYVGGDIIVFDENGTTSVSGGTIEGDLEVYSVNLSITGGCMSLCSYADNATISAGTFHGNDFYGNCTIAGANTTISGGNFTDCSSLSVNGTTWICGGSFSRIQANDATLYLSGVPEIEELWIGKPNTVSAQNPDGTGSFGGDPLEVTLAHPNYSTEWQDDDIVIRNVTSDAVASRFVLTGEDPRWTSLERSDDNLVLQVLPHGTWGTNVNWVVKNGVLTVSGTGAINYASSGSVYPWYNYKDQFTAIVVEPGITGIPSYTFEYLEDVTSITLPDTLRSLALNAFNDCGSLNDLLLPASIVAFEGTSNTGAPAFIRCESLTDVYYLGTAEEWSMLPRTEQITSSDSDMTMHFLKLHESTATCTAYGTDAYYQFDDTSVYDDLYNLDKQIISQPAALPPQGHRIIVDSTEQVNPLAGSNINAVPFTQSGNTYTSANQSHSSSSEITITALHACTLTLNYGVSSEANYDKLIILQDNIQKDAISGIVSSKSITLTLTAGDVITVRYSKDSSQSSNQDEGWVTLEYEMVTVETKADIPADTFEADCRTGVVCDYCGVVVKQPLPHTEVIDDAVAPTCITAGLTAGIHCGVCAEELVPQEVIAPSGHMWIDATCSAPKTCSVCGTTEGEAAGHTEVSHEGKQPTCVEFGWNTYVTCVNCDYTTYEQLDATGTHTLDAYGKCIYCQSADLPVGYDPSTATIVLHDLPENTETVFISIYNENGQLVGIVTGSEDIQISLPTDVSAYKICVFYFGSSWKLVSDCYTLFW